MTGGRWLRSFYGRHIGTVQESLLVSEHIARRHCREQLRQLVEDGVGCMERWDGQVAENLARSAMSELENEL